LAPETRLPRILEDVQDAYEWAATTGADELGIDPTRIALVGHSAGGYLAFCIAEAVRPRPRAVVSFYGYGDILGDWYTHPNPFHLRQPLVPEDLARDGLGRGEVSEANGEERWRFYRYCRQRGSWPEEVSGFDLLADRATLDAYCPVRRVSSQFPPTLLLHGDSDRDVPFTESVSMLEALLAAGVAADLVAVPRCGHMFDQGGTKQADEAFARVVEFLQAMLLTSSGPPDRRSRRRDDPAVRERRPDRRVLDRTLARAVRLRNPPVRGRGRGPRGLGAGPRGADAAGDPPDLRSPER
jgi:acetyl esterase/lipase